MKALIIDDHPMVQDGLELLLRHLDTDIDIDKASCLDEIRNRADEKLDLILYDVMLPNRTVEEGLNALRALHERIPDTPIIVITALRDRGCVSRALEAGARAYIPKSFTSEIILSAIRLVLSGGVYVPPELFDGMGNGTAQRVPLTPATNVEDGGPALTRRQRDVLTFLSRGCSNKEIARELGVAEGTIKIHVAAIFKVLSVTNRTQAVIAASRLGISSENGPTAEMSA
ncbi:MAG: response regulator [Alphaproteobacteria bacterium]|nr:response regulator [Alphaproteobacteria bacterium]